MRSPTWIVLVLAAAGCGESTGPDTDLSGLRASLSSINTVFAAPLVRSLGTFWLGGPLPVPAPGAPPVPDSLLGKTFTFSCASQHYAVSGDSGAPATGVRIILYRRASDGSIACPVTLVGQLDVFDVSAPGTAAVRGVATGTDGAEPLAAYTISHNVADPGGVASATGFVGDGQQRLQFQVTGSRGADSHTPTATLQVDDSTAGRHIVLHHDAQMGVDTYSDALDLSVQHPGGNADLAGSVGWFNTRRSWDQVVSVNDVPFAKVGGSLVRDDQEPALTPLNGQLFFTGEQRRVLLDFVNAPGVIRDGLAGVLSVGAHLVGFAL